MGLNIVAACIWLAAFTPCCDLTWLLSQPSTVRTAWPGVEHHPTQPPLRGPRSCAPRTTCGGGAPTTVAAPSPFTCSSTPWASWSTRCTSEGGGGGGSAASCALGPAAAAKEALAFVARSLPVLPDRAWLHDPTWPGTSPLVSVPLAAPAAQPHRLHPCGALPVLHGPDGVVPVPGHGHHRLPLLLHLHLRHLQCQQEREWVGIVVGALGRWARLSGCCGTLQRCLQHSCCASRCPVRCKADLWHTGLWSHIGGWLPPCCRIEDWPVVPPWLASRQQAPLGARRHSTEKDPNAPLCPLRDARQHQPTCFCSIPIILDFPSWLL